MESREAAKIKLENARQVAGRAWCTLKTRNIPIDSNLAEAFARILVKEMYAPHLGYATTRDLIDEIRARVDLDYMTNM